jgi:enoyl-CoA hydratase/carnithine racemase
MGIDRVEKRNGLTPEMYRELQDALTLLDEDPELWVGLLFAHGEHFTAGLDLPKFATLMKTGESPLTPGKVDIYGRERRCRKPVITAVQGITFTAGIELMLATDIVVAASDCRFSQLEPARGIMATGGAVARFLDRAGWGNAMYHLLTADEFGAEEARRIGLVQEVVAPERLFGRAMELAEVVASRAPLAIQATKANAATYLIEGQRAAFAELDYTQSRLAASEDAAEGVRSFIERRAAVFRGR